MLVYPRQILRSYGDYSIQLPIRSSLVNEASVLSQATAAMVLAAVIQSSSIIQPPSTSSYYGSHAAILLGQTINNCFAPDRTCPALELALFQVLPGTLVSAVVGLYLTSSSSAACRLPDPRVGDGLRKLTAQQHTVT